MITRATPLPARASRSSPGATPQRERARGPRASHAHPCRSALARAQPVDSRIRCHVTGIRPPSARPMITWHPPERPLGAPDLARHPGPATRPMITWPLRAGALPIGRFENPLLRNGYPAPERTPHDHLHPPERPLGAPDLAGHPGPAARPMITWPLPAGAPPNGRFENPLLRNGYPAPERTPHDHLHPPERPLGAPDLAGHPGPAARPMITWPLPAGAPPNGRFENPLSWNGDPAASARPMITRPLLHQRAPIGQARVPPHNEASPRTARPPCTPCRSPLARAHSVDPRIRCHVTGIRP